MAADDRLAELSAKYGRDPEALEWARLHVERLRNKYRGFETAARDQGRDEQSTFWRKLANMLDMQLIGGRGCVITPFDERCPTLPDLRAITPAQPGEETYRA